MQHLRDRFYQETPNDYNRKTIQRLFYRHFHRMGRSMNMKACIDPACARRYRYKLNNLRVKGVLHMRRPVLNDGENIECLLKPPETEIYRQLFENRPRNLNLRLWRLTKDIAKELRIHDIRRVFLQYFPFALRDKEKMMDLLIHCWFERPSDTIFKQFVSDDNDTICAICLDPIIGIQSKLRCRCIKGFHPQCLARWLQLSLSCPTCRFHES